MLLDLLSFLVQLGKRQNFLEHSVENSSNSGAPTGLLVFMLQVQWVQFEGSNDVHSLLHPVDECQQTPNIRGKADLWLQDAV